MPDKKQTSRIHSRIEITDPALVKSIEQLQKESGHKTKPQLEWIIAQYFQNKKRLKELDAEVWKLRMN